MNDVHVKEDKFYDLSEVIGAVKKTLDLVSEKSNRHNELRYSSTDVYWLLYDMLQYINRNVPEKLREKAQSVNFPCSKPEKGFIG